MARFNIRKMSPDKTTGFGENTNYQSGRFFNVDGQPNVVKTGLSRSEGWSWFHQLIDMPTHKFLGFVLIGFITINTLFTIIYFAVGIQGLQGVKAGTWWEQFFEVFFFSAQTFTTVGYGRISPDGILSGLVSTIEAFAGLMTFALASSLFYARFAKPKIHIRFASKALIGPYKTNKKALMIRLAPMKGGILTELEAKVTLAIKNLNNESTNKFYQLPLEISHINALPMSWTLVHEINEESPLYGFEAKDYSETDFEILVFMKAFDEGYANQVVTRYSYTNKEVFFGGKFRIMYYPSSDKLTTIIDFDLIDEYDEVKI